MELKELLVLAMVELGNFTKTKNMDLQIKTYIKKDRSFIIKKATQNDESLFEDIDNIQKLDKSKLDYDYLDGVLVIEYQEEKLLDFQNWDLITQLLYYFVDGLDKLSNQKEVEFSFPDQPFPVVMKNEGDAHLNIYFNQVKTTIPKMKFVVSMLDASEKFYRQLSKLFPEYASDIGYYQSKVRDVKKSYDL